MKHIVGRGLAPAEIQHDVNIDNKFFLCYNQIE